MSYHLNELKELTTSQYDTCKAAALERIKSRIGDRPTRAQFTRELGSLWTVLDVLGLIVFAAALLISSVHIIQHMGILATRSYADASGQYGTTISADLWVSVHQWSYIALAEASMLLFMVGFGITKNWRKWVNLLLALVAASFVIIANWQSGTGALESIMPPVFTIGLGFHLERLIVQTLRRRQNITKRYLDALTVYEEASQDASKHPDYLPMLRQELWQKLTSLKANNRYVDAPAPFKVMATEREMQRDLWAYGEGETVIKSGNFHDIAPVQSNGHEAHDDPFLAPALTTNGKH